MTLARAIDPRRQALRDRFPIWTPHSLADWLDICADRYGELPLVLTDEVRLSYADVAAESRRLAAGLAARGFVPVTGWAC